MSHFSVTVIGPNVIEQLEPFQEFECTGKDGPYVQDVDVTDEIRNDFENFRKDLIRFTNGDEVDAYSHDSRLFREPTEAELQKIEEGPFGHNFRYITKDWGDGKGPRLKIFELPEGAENIQKPYDSFKEYLQNEYDVDFFVPHGEEPDITGKHKYGYALLDESGEIIKVIRRTNPNCKWDWWQVGGRWSGFLKLKEGAQGLRGEPGLLGTMRNDSPQFVDHALKKDIDFEGTRNEAGQWAGELFDKVMTIIGGRSFLTWEETLREFGGVAENGEPIWEKIDECRKIYHQQQVLKDLWDEVGIVDLDDFKCDREEYVQRARNRAFVTYALLKDGEWLQRGEMLMFGISDDQMTEDEWLAKFNQILDDLPEDTPITIVDCHI